MATQLATIEWGTFLGPGHVARVDVVKLRDSRAFERVVEVSPSLVYLQVTADPRDDLTGELETKLPEARAALDIVQMDISDVTLE
ncbi:MAG: hypothetical protein M3680_00715 [Myxococcota bacterium]|nr:hypothetical protein [Myxococcota bacterium]